MTTASLDPYASMIQQLLGGSGNNGTTTTNTGPSTVTTNGNQTTNSNQNQITTGNQNTNTVTDTSTMDPKSLAALQTLIAQLMGGGTQQQANDRALRLGEVNQVRGIRSEYSKANAFTDAQGAIAQAMRQTLEQMLPGITRSAEGAGTSQSSVRGLLLNDAAARASEAGSALGLKAAVDYGGIQSNLSNTLATLTQPNDTVTQDLLAALQAAKGDVTHSTSSSNTDTTQNSNTTGTSNTVSNQVQNSAPTQSVVNKSPASLDSLVQSLSDQGVNVASGSGTAPVSDALAYAAMLQDGWSGYNF